METKRLLRLVNVNELKKQLEVEGEEVIHYSDLLKECQGMGVAKSTEEAADFAKVLDEAGVVLLFRDKVYLHPDKVVELVRKAMPLALTPQSDTRRRDPTYQDLMKRLFLSRQRGSSLTNETLTLVDPMNCRGSLSLLLDA